jgi:hypothetical protein
MVTVIKKEEKNENFSGRHNKKDEIKLLPTV